ncbi:hypothetical protein [Streptomonospora litoralis]|uniref:Lipoprotein n=1 Tax=Streptomonospora litoralis TaxID=2498135 RepID=A0A4V0ZJD1_9ACTN|nr:hypothetical protein [Streptomonospora litoralis]QBI53062.1 hypothetical protein EKD16_06320 [Streptomonospora litoralis]
MRGTERVIAAAAAAAVLSMAGCADGGDDPGGPPSTRPPTQDAGGSTAPSPEQASKGGMNGVWESRVADSGISTLVVEGDQVRTEGATACPGTLTPAESGSTARIRLDCDPPDPGHESGTAVLNAEDDHLIVNWEGSDGIPESFARTSQEPDIDE